MREASNRHVGSTPVGIENSNGDDAADDIITD